MKFLRVRSFGLLSSKQAMLDDYKGTRLIGTIWRLPVTCPPRKP